MTCGQVVVALRPDEDPVAFAADYGLIHVGPVGAGSLADTHLFYYRCGGNKRGNDNDDGTTMRRDARALNVMQQVAKQQFGRQIINLTGFVPRQWHLDDEAENRATAHILGAWSLGFLGEGVTVSVVDDGLDHAHPDMAPNYIAVASGNYNPGGARGDPAPIYDEAHGTAAGSVAAAAGSAPTVPLGQGTCGIGVAPRARLAGVRLIAAPSTDADEARALAHASSYVDVYSCSWGPPDDGATLDGPGPLAAASIAHTARHGGARGKGSVYCWAAGNGRRVGDTCSHDAYATHPDVLAIGAMSFDGRASDYSESCPGLFVVAPSSGDGRSISAADIRGRRGSSTGDCRTDFGGTSSAAPFVAGVMALVLSAHPDIGGREAARIVRRTARRVDVAHPSWTQNAAEVWHSDIYGFGTPDALAAVTALVGPEDLAPAAEWSGSATTCYVHDWRGNGQRTHPLPCDAPDGSTGVAGSQALAVSCVDVDDARLVVERAVATVTVDNNARRSDIDIMLISPAGTVARFVRRRADRGRDGYIAWPFESLKTWGEPAFGSWCVVVEDLVQDGVSGGRLARWSLRLIGIAGDTAQTVV